MSDDLVDNSEILYRRIAAGRRLYEKKDDRRIEISSLAFSDRGFRISVDRAKLCDNNPRYTMGDEPGVVAILIAGQIRNIDDLTRNDPGGSVIQRFKIVIEPAPLPSNPAHAEIYAIPDFTAIDKKAAFHRLSRRLARLAEAGQWVDLSEC